MRQFGSDDNTAAQADSSALDWVLSLLAKMLTEKSAEEIVNFKLDETTQALINALADKAAAGTLSGVERAEYLEFVEAIDILSVFHA